MPIYSNSNNAKAWRGTWIIDLQISGIYGWQIKKQQLSELTI
jgi:hypothetical protein